MDNTLRKAAEMALKLLENKRLLTDEHLIPIIVDDLRQAIAQDEQEPVWCGCGDGIVVNDEAMCGVCVMRLKHQIERLKAQIQQAPPSKPWVSLTDEEIDYIWGVTPPDYENFFEFPRAIEAKLKEKNT